MSQSKHAADDRVVILRRRHLLFLLVLALATVGLLAPVHKASALSIGLSWSGGYPEDTAEMEQVRRSGATVLRVPIDLTVTENGTDWSVYDALFEQGRKFGVRIQPILVRAEGGSTRFPVQSEYPAWSAWVGKVIGRYGGGGTFWAGKPNPNPPIAWEVWNEPNLKSNNPLVWNGSSWVEQVQPQAYANFLGITQAPIRNTLPGYQPLVLFGGLFMPGGMNYSSFLEQAGSTAYYDGVSIHPYGFYAADKSLEVAQFIGGVRNTLNTKVAGGASKSLWVTELGWPVMNPNGHQNVPAVTEYDQAQLLTKSFNWIKNNAVAKNIQGVLWYNFRDIPSRFGVQSWDGFSGLKRANGTFRAAWGSFQAQAGVSRAPTTVINTNVGGLTSYSAFGAFGLASGVAKGTSPSIAQMDTGGFVVAYQNTAGNMAVYHSVGNWVKETGLGMAPGTSPSIAALPNGNYVAAMQSNLGYLTTYSPTEGTNGWGLGMAAGTSPSITQRWSGGWIAAFQANTGNLTTYSPQEGLNGWGLGMASGTSPSIATRWGGGWTAAFQANHGLMTTYSPSEGLTGWMGMASKTSPSIAMRYGGGWVVAFHANTGYPYVYSSGVGLKTIGSGLAAGTSPSIVTTPSGGWVTAFHINTGDFQLYSSSEVLTPVGMGLSPGSSPSITLGE